MKQSILTCLAAYLGEGGGGVCHKYPANIYLTQESTERVCMRKKSVVCCSCAAVVSDLLTYLLRMACMCSTNGTPHLVPPHTAHICSPFLVPFLAFCHSLLPACLPAWGNKPFFFCLCFNTLKLSVKSPSLSLSLSLSRMGSYLCSVCTYKCCYILLFP